MGGPLVFGVEGWKLKPEHFAERHGLIMIIALGESIVAIGIGAEAGVGAGEVVAAVAGIAVACALWWLYFDVVALVAARRLMKASVGREQNAIARDSYSIIHLPMVAGIVLLALGLKKTLEHVGDPLELEVATAMLGGIAIYLLAHAAFRYRNIGRVSRMRISAAGVLLALIPIATEISATLTVAAALVVLVILIGAEVSRQGELRERLRHQVSTG
jgi:low temperature requirement protein LtrA